MINECKDMTKYNIIVIHLAKWITYDVKYVYHSVKWLTPAT